MSKLASARNSPTEAALLTVLVLVIASAVVYVLSWTILVPSGCGPAGHSTSGRIFTAVPFVLPMLAAATYLGVSARLRWGWRTAIVGVLMTVVTAALTELVLFAIEYVAHHCNV